MEFKKFSLNMLNFEHKEGEFDPAFYLFIF